MPTIELKKIRNWSILDIDGYIGVCWHYGLINYPILYDDGTMA